MQTINWRFELEEWAEALKRTTDSESAALLMAEIECLDVSSLVVFPSTARLTDVAIAMREEDCDVALIRDDEDSLEGIVRLGRIERALAQPGFQESDTPVIDLVERTSFCIERESTPIIQIIERLTHGGYSCAVIVDQLARPQGLVSARSLLSALTEFLPGEVLMVSNF